MAVDLGTEFADQLLHYLRETFEEPEGLFLDPDTSLLQTLKGITAEQASIPVGGKCASLAAQVSHVIYYIESWERYVLENDESDRDWEHVWNSVEKVNRQEWDELREKLRDAYGRMETMIGQNSLWNGDRMGGAMSIVVHTAYHLGEIRQAMCQLG